MLICPNNIAKNLKKFPQTPTKIINPTQWLFKNALSNFLELLLKAAYVDKKTQTCAEKRFDISNRNHEIRPKN